MLKQNQILTKVEELERRLRTIQEQFDLHNHSGSDTRKVDYKRLNNQPISNSKVIDGRLGGGGLTIGANGSLSTGATAYNAGTGIWFEYNAGTPRVFIGNASGNKMLWTGTALEITGSITATTGAIGGFTLGATTLSATNLVLTSGAANTAHIAVGTGSNLAGMNSGNAAGDIAFWAGDTFANRATADFFITMAGVVKAESITLETNVVVKDLQAGSVIDGTYIAALSVSKLTTGTIASKQITLGVTGGVGDVYIAGGTFDAATWTATGGFILGIDDSDSDLAKFFIGNATSYLSWNGSAFVVKGASVINAPAVYELTAGEALTANDAVQMGYNTGAEFIPGHDAKVVEASPGSNYGNTTDLITQYNGATSINSFLKFNFSGLPIGNLISATLYLYITVDPSANITANFSRVTGADWDESTITWTNKPAVYGSTFATKAISNGQTGAISVDITTQVSNWFDSTHPNYGFYLSYSGANTPTTYGSSEHATVAYRPYLVLVYDNTKIFQSSAVVSGNTTKWLGFVTNSPSAEGVANIQLNDIKTLSGLTAGSLYYLSDTRGAISTSAGTVSKKVGLALSTTKIFLDRVV